MYLIRDDLLNLTVLYNCCIDSIVVNMSFAEAVCRFNSNISYSGLLHAVTADVSKMD